MQKNFKPWMDTVKYVTWMVHANKQQSKQMHYTSVPIWHDSFLKNEMEKDHFNTELDGSFNLNHKM